jgi:hypothetical protein
MIAYALGFVLGMGSVFLLVAISLAVWAAITLWRTR